MFVCPFRDFLFLHLYTLFYVRVYININILVEVNFDSQSVQYEVMNPRWEGIVVATIENIVRIESTTTISFNELL